MLEQEPEPSSALTLEPRPHCLCHPGVQGAGQPQPGHTQQVTRPLSPSQHAKPGASQERDHTGTLPGGQEAPVVTQKEKGWLEV